jgi:protein SCO1/2
MTRFILIAVVMATFALAGCGSGSSSTSTGAAAQVESGGGGGLPSGIAGKRAPRMRLVDARTGSRFDTNSLAGRAYAVTFLYTHCRTTCPVIADEMRVALAKLGSAADKAAVVALSADPVGDTRATVRRFLAQHHEPPQFHYLIGSRSKLEPLWRAWYAASQPAGAASSIHTAAIWFVDSRGRIADLVSAGVPVPPATIASKFRSLAD